MTIASNLLKTNHIGVRDLKEHLSKQLLKNTLIITNRGTPVSVNLPYSDMLELVDILDELSDAETLEAISDGRKSIKAGTKGRLVSKLFDRIGKESK